MSAYLRAGVAWGLCLGLLCILAMLAVVGPAVAFSLEEQEWMLDESLALLAEELGGSYDPELARLVLPDGGGAELILEFGSMGFGASVSDNGDIYDSGRQHPLGSTVLTELSELSENDLSRFLEQDGGKAPGGNVTARFLAHHWRAMRWAKDARQAGRAERDEFLRLALLEEALALSHLMDAFSSSHFFYPGRDFLNWFHRTNNRERQERARFLGAYVMDSRGEAWQCFGDGLLRWHPGTQEMTGAAVLSSLREFFAMYYLDLAPAPLVGWYSEHSPRDDALGWVRSWYDSAEGRTFYEEYRLPSLLRIPMAIQATWSERDASRIEHGIAARRHWPQLREAGFHDPELGEKRILCLPSSQDVPVWLHLPQLESSTPEEFLLRDPELASVRFDQQRTVPPSFKGGLLILGAGRNLRGNDSAWLLSGGVGWGIADKLLPLRQLLVFQRMSVELRAHWDPDSADAFGVLALGTQLDSGGVPGALHLELGVADGWQGRYTNWGMHLGIGLASRSVKLPGIYVGGMARLRYSVAYMGEAVHTITLDFLIH